MQVREFRFELSTNPYEPTTQSIPLARGGEDADWTGLLLGFGYPMLLLAILHLYWFLAWVSLGHPPRPSLDDPVEVGSLPMLWLSGSMMMVAPGVAVLVVITELLNLLGSSRPIQIRFLWIVMVATCWIAAYAYVWWDPLRLFEWYMD